MSSNKVKQSRPVQIHKKTLKCAVVIMCLQTGMCLKLTQVPHLAKTLDLDQEAKWVAVAFNDARALMTNKNEESSEHDASTLLHNRAIKRLHSTIERWSLVEDRLQNGISNNDQIQTRVFDEAVSVIAAGRVLLGQLFWRSKGDDMALKELEPSCPTLWEYDVARTSLDNDGWLDCYSTLGDIYVRRSRLEQAVELEKELISRMPWLALTFSGKPTNFKLRTLATISHLMRATREDRRMISVYIKSAWRTAENLRAQLNELVSEFVTSNTDSKRKNIFNRTQAIVEEALQHFVQESNISILQYSRVQKSQLDSNNAVAGNEEMPMLAGDTNVAHVDDSAKTESEALTRKRESTLLNSALRVELHREASFYLSTMDGILEGGKHFLPAIRMRELEKAQIKFQSKYPTVGRDGIAPLTGAPSSSSITAAPMGFQSKDQVMQVFEYLMAHQADKQDQAEVARVAAASARATRKSASTGFKNKRNSTGTRAASEASSKSNQKEGRSNSRSSTDQANASATSYGLVGTFIALFTGGILLWGSANKEHGYRSSSGNNSKSRGEKTAAHINRISKHSMVPNKNEDIKENDDNFLWNVLVILIGEKNTMMIPKGLEKLCARGSNICRLLHLKTMANFHNMLFVATILLQWIRKLMNRACQEIESRRQNSAAQSNFQTGTLPSWTTYVSASPTNKKKIRDDNSREAPTRSLAKKETLNSSKSLTKNKNMSTDIVNKNKISKKKTRTQVTSKSVDYTATVITSLHDEVVVSHSEIISAHVTVKDSETNDLYSDEVLDDFIQQKDDDISISSLERPRISTSSPTLSLMTTTTTPSSPSSVAAIDEVQSVILSDAQVFDDSYWRNIDNEAEDEGAWIETVTLPSKGKLRKTQNDERLTQTIQPLSKQRQEVFRQQLVRKSAEAAFSSTSMSGRDRHSNLALQQAKRGIPTLRKKSPTHTTPTTSSSSPSSSSSVLTTSSVVAIPSYSSKEISLTATATLKTMSGKSNSTRSHQPLVPEHLILAVEFPPLPIYGSVQSASSSAENSTDAEDQSSISGDSHLSSPRSRSFSCGHDTVNTSDEQMVDPIIHQPLQQGLMGHHMQMPYYPLGFMPMTMQHTVYDPSMNLSFSPPTGILSSEQQQGLLHHQQAIMMMPYPSIYMLPHPQFDPQFGHMQHQQQHSQIHGNHIMNTTEQQIEYNTHMNQMYHESQVVPSDMSLSIPIVEEPILDSNDIVEIVRQQIAYYFSSSNLCHDMYLRSKMDCEGFVRLSEISNWNRIRRIGATEHTVTSCILEAVQSCRALEVRKLCNVKTVGGSEEDTAMQSSISILSTLIRCAENPLSWVLQQPANIGASNDTDTSTYFPIH